MSTYPVIAAASFAAAFCLFFVELKRRGQRPGIALTVLPFSLLLAVALAKLLYELLMRMDYFLIWGEWEVFLDFTPKHLCFTAGIAGACLGVRLTAGRGENAAVILDCFAAPVSLLIAGLRLAESEQGLFGAGAYAGENGLFSRPPFAVTDAWGDAYVAVFFWEALAALAIGLAVLLSRETRPGLRFQKTILALCLTQLLLENLRTQGMRWGFVHTEQAICAVIILILTAAACRRSRKKKHRWLPVPLYVLCVAAFIAAEFARQKGGSLFWTRYGYGFLILVLLAMAWNYGAAVRGGSEGKAVSASSSSMTENSGQESSKGM